MKMTIYQDDFVELFKKCGRENNFSRSSLYKIFDYYEQIEEDLDEDVTVDVIGICCDWSETTVVTKEIEGKEVHYVEDYSMEFEDFCDHTTVLYNEHDLRKDSFEIVYLIF